MQRVSSDAELTSCHVVGVWLVKRVSSDAELTSCHVVGVWLVKRVSSDAEVTLSCSWCFVGEKSKL